MRGDGTGLLGPASQASTGAHCPPEHVRSTSQAMAWGLLHRRFGRRCWCSSGRPLGRGGGAAAIRAACTPGRTQPNPVTVAARAWMDAVVAPAALFVCVQGQAKGCRGLVSVHCTSGVKKQVCVRSYLFLFNAVSCRRFLSFKKPQGQDPVPCMLRCACSEPRTARPCVQPPVKTHCYLLVSDALLMLMVVGSGVGRHPFGPLCLHPDFVALALLAGSPRLRAAR